MFGLGYRMKIKFWMLAIRFSSWLKRTIERRAAKSVGLIGAGAMLVDRQGQILATYLKTLEETTPFKAN